MKLGALARKTTRMTAAEYQAHLTGINIFFGAVLGFVINGIEGYTGEARQRIARVIEAIARTRAEQH